MRMTITRYHDFSAGHRVHGHEGACAHLHGHNYRVYFTVEAPETDVVGRVMDFSMVKDILCQWLEDNWDHRFLMWDGDPWVIRLNDIDQTMVLLNFNPTAENMAKHLLLELDRLLYDHEGLHLVRVEVQETRKCSATASYPWETMESIKKMRLETDDPLFL